MYPYMATTDENDEWWVALHGKLLHYHHDMDAAIKHAKTLNDALTANRLKALELAQGR
jgi:hypothetical protein